MSAANTFRLVTPHEDDPIPFERRLAPRHRLTGRVTAVRPPCDGKDTAGQIFSLQLLDISDDGLGCLSTDAIDLDAPIVVFFPPHGPERGFDAYGHVVRCQRQGAMHEVGILFSNRLAA